jgi:hypothetical protein
VGATAPSAVINLVEQRKPRATGGGLAWADWVAAAAVEAAAVEAAGVAVVAAAVAGEEAEGGEAKVLL